MAVKMLPTSTIKMQLGIEKNGRVESFLASTCKKHMDKYVPRRDGYLRTSARVEGSKVIYETPYAHYQYIGKLYIDPETGSSYAKKGATKISTDIDLHYHGGGGSYWDRNMVSAEKEDVAREVQDFVRR